MAGRKERTTRAEVEAWLLKQSREQLAEIITDRAREDGEFLDMLRLHVAAGQPVEEVPDLRGVIADAMMIDGFVSWRETSHYYGTTARLSVSWNA